jgi:L-glyceraldehyde 3-phosphate reductase
MAIAWVLREGKVTTALIGASKPDQVQDCVGAINNLNFSSEELLSIDEIAKDQDINLWAQSSESD